MTGILATIPLRRITLTILSTIILLSHFAAATANAVAIDKSVLIATITSAQATHDAAIEGNLTGQYPLGH